MFCLNKLWAIYYSQCQIIAHGEQTQRHKRRMSFKVKANIIYGKRVKTCTPSKPPCQSSPFLSSPSLKSIIYSQLLHPALVFSDFPPITQQHHKAQVHSAQRFGLQSNPLPHPLWWKDKSQEEYILGYINIFHDLIYKFVKGVHPYVESLDKQSFKI